MYLFDGKRKYITCVRDFEKGLVIQVFELLVCQSWNTVKRAKANSTMREYNENGDLHSAVLNNIEA